MTGTTTAVMDFHVTLTGVGRQTTVLPDQRPGTMSGVHGVNGVSAVSYVEALGQGPDLASAPHQSREASSAPDRLTLRQRNAMLLHAGLTLETGVPALFHGKILY